MVVEFVATVDAVVVNVAAIVVKFVVVAIVALL